MFEPKVDLKFASGQHQQPVEQHCKQSVQGKTFDLQGPFLHTFTLSFGTLTKFEIVKLFL